MKYFKNKVAVVTGAGSGMGRALAIGLAKRGALVAVCDVNQETLDETVKLLGNTQNKVSSFIVDIADDQQIRDMAQQIRNEYGKINLLFNNAGVSVTNSVEKMPLEDFEWLMNINFWGVVNGCRIFLPYFREVDDAHIINTSSIFGIIGVPSQAAYNASKFAVRGFTSALQQELMDTHIKVTCVHPGGVKTNIIRESRFTPLDNESPSKEEFIKSFNEFAGLTADQAADIILKGVSRKKKRILVGRDAIFVSILERLFPVSYPFITNRLFRLGRS